MNVVSATGNVSYTPDANFNGTDSFVVVVTDSNGARFEQTILVTVRPVNDAHAWEVTISGIAEPGRALTASDDLADIDGVGTIAYQWYRDGEAISGEQARAMSRALRTRGTRLVKASFTDGDGTVETAASDGVLIASPVAPQAIHTPLRTPSLATYASQSVRQMQVMSTLDLALAAKNEDEIGKDRYTRASSPFTNFGSLLDAGGSNAGGSGPGQSDVKAVAINRGPFIELRLMSTGASPSGEIAVQLTGQQFEVVEGSGDVDKIGGSVFIPRGGDKAEVILDIIQSDGM